jgi:hypothetical protein
MSSKPVFYSIFLGPIRPRAVGKGGAQGAVGEGVKQREKLEIRKYYKLTLHET